MIKFIGLGAQKSGTSWIHACLYEHPEICSPVKEIHYFSRERYCKGKDWYEQHWRNCKDGQVMGEFSTSYFYDKNTPKRIYDDYADARLVVVVRNPIERAYSQYRNAIKAGEIKKDCDFSHYVTKEESCLKQGLYFEQLSRFKKFFEDDQILVMVYEDIKDDPLSFISKIYKHIGVDSSFLPPSLYARINTARTPHLVAVDSITHLAAESLRKIGLDKFVHYIKNSGLPDLVRRINTTKDGEDKLNIKSEGCHRAYFKEDARLLGNHIGRDLVLEWQL